MCMIKLTRFDRGSVRKATFILPSERDSPHMSSPNSPSRLLSSFQHWDLNGQDVWDEGTILFQPYEVEQILMPDAAQCLSVRAYLKMLNLPFNICYRRNAEFMSPTVVNAVVFLLQGKVPFIKSGEFVISEMESIVQFAESKGHTLTESLNSAEKSDMMAFISLVKLVLGNAEKFAIWCDPKTLPLTKRRYGSVFSTPLNHIMTFLRKRENVRYLKAVKFPNTSDEVYKCVEKCCEALSNRLGTSEYFFNGPTELDALVFGHIYTILTTVLPEEHFATTIRSFSNLIDHCTRIEKLYFNFQKVESLK